MTEEALEAAKNAHAVVLGAIGGPVSRLRLRPSAIAVESDELQKWGTGSVRPEQGLLRLRQALDSFGNLRPCNFASPRLVASSPLKESVCRDTDFVIVRELTGGIYFGARKEDTGDGKAFDTEEYSAREIERVARLAGRLAMSWTGVKGGEKKVISLDKANVLATSRLWRRVVGEVMAKEFPDVSLEHMLVDSAAMVMVRDPRRLNGVVVTSNLFGDIVSDEASVIPGSLGLLPSASLVGLPSDQGVNGIYEPIHGQLNFLSSHPLSLLSKGYTSIISG